MQTLFQAGLIDAIAAVAAAAGGFGGFFFAHYLHRQERRRFRSLSKYCTHLQRELDDLRKAPPTATVQRSDQIVPLQRRR